MSSKGDKTKRFRILEEQNLHVGFIRVMVDLETGVNYIMVSDESNCGITPLLDAENKPVVSDLEKLKAALKEEDEKKEAEKKKKKEEKAAKAAEKKAAKDEAEAKKAVKAADKDKAKKAGTKKAVSASAKSAKKTTKKTAKKSAKPVDPYADL